MLSSSARAPALLLSPLAGFEDAIEIGRQARTNLYDLTVRCIEPLVARDVRFGVEEGTRPDGSIEPSPSAADLLFHHEGG